MPNLRVDGSANHFHRPDHDAPGAWLTAAVAGAIMVGLISVLHDRPYDSLARHQGTVINMTELAAAVP
jgi:hypothetical protein